MGKRHDRKWSKGLDKAFSREELQQFMSVIDNDKHKMCFELQAGLGLRIEEAVNVNVRDLRLEGNAPQARIVNVKTKEVEYLPIRKGLVTRIKKYLEDNYWNIEKNDGYLIYTERSGRRGRASSTCMRTAFLRYLRDAELDEVYKTIPISGAQCKNGCKVRKLHRLSTHSLRHYYGTQIYRRTKNPKLVQALLRHKSLTTTTIYINSTQEEAREALEATFESSRPPISSLEKPPPDFINMVWQLWKAQKDYQAADAQTSPSCIV